MNRRTLEVVLLASAMGLSGCAGPGRWRGGDDDGAGLLLVGAVIGAVVAVAVLDDANDDHHAHHRGHSRHDSHHR
jgi:hypothetical protein